MTPLPASTGRNVDIFARNNENLVNLRIKDVEAKKRWSWTLNGRLGVQGNLDGAVVAAVHWLRDTARAEEANAAYAGNGPRPRPRCGISPSACSISPVSPRSPALSKPSTVTEAASSTTHRYKTQISNDFGDPVARTGDVQSPDGFHRADALVQPRLYFVADISAHGRGYAVRGTVR